MTTFFRRNCTSIDSGLKQQNEMWLVQGWHCGEVQFTQLCQINLWVRSSSCGSSGSSTSSKKGGSLTTVLLVVPLPTDLCKICSVRNLVFPAWEAFEERLANPNNYVVFYEYFLRSAVGEEEWKMRASNKAEPMVIDDVISTRLTPPLNEAFAFVLLKNNYFAWLLEGKQTYDSMLTDYDDDIGPEYGSLVTYLLQGGVVDLQERSRDETFVLIPTAGNDESGRESQKYCNANTDYQNSVKAIREKVKDSAKYKQVLKAFEDLLDDGNTNVCSSERKKKKRKIVKQLKPYTGIREEKEKAYRGWSVRGLKDMSRIKKSIQQESEAYSKFDAAYRYFYAQQQRSTGGNEQSQSSSGSEEEDDGDLNDDLFDFQGT